MKIKPGFVLREVMGDMVAVPTGEAAKTFHGMVRLNKTAYEIWQGLEAGKDLSQIASDMAAVYDAAPEKIEVDVKSVAEQLQQAGIIEE